MRESGEIARSYLRAHWAELGLPEDFHKNTDIHVHLPEGATPKDGPSAGITMVTCLVSLLSGRPVRHDLAMTGEISLRGKVMQIGGLREKVMAAHRAGIKTVLAPADNKKDLGRHSGRDPQRPEHYSGESHRRGAEARLGETGQEVGVTQPRVA